MDIENSLWQEYKDKGVVVWGIGSADDFDSLVTLRDQMGLTFPVLYDEGGVVMSQYDILNQEVSPYPQDWVVGSDGQVLYYNTAYEVDEISAVIDEDLAP